MFDRVVTDFWRLDPEGSGDVFLFLSRATIVEKTLCTFFVHKVYKVCERCANDVPTMRKCTTHKCTTHKCTLNALPTFYSYNTSVFP